MTTGTGTRSSRQGKPRPTANERNIARPRQQHENGMVPRSLLCPIQRPISRLPLSLTTTTARCEVRKRLFYSTHPITCDTQTPTPPAKSTTNHRLEMSILRSDPKRMPQRLNATLYAPRDIVEFLRSVDTPTLEVNDVWRFVKCVGKDWSRPQIQDALERCSEGDKRLTILLFRLLTMKYYEPTKDMSGLVACIPLSSPSDIQTRLYNMALSAGIKVGRLDHVEKVLERMKERDVDLDVASYTIFIRSLLIKGHMKEALAMYDNMVMAGINPTVATYNTFLGHACRHQLWDDFDMWMERLGDRANTITLRILMRAVSQHKSQANVVSTLERVFTMVKPKHGSETELGPAVAALLRHQRTSTALEVLDCIFKSQTQVSVIIYNLYIKALAQKGDLATAHQVLDHMISSCHPKNSRSSTPPIATTTKIPPPPDVFSFTTLIQGYIEHAPSDNVPMETVMKLYRQLQSLGIRQTPVLYSVLIQGILKTKFVKMQSVRALFDHLVQELEKENPSGKKGFEPMQAPFRRGPGYLTLPHRHYHFSRTSLYNIMMNGYFVHENYRKERTGASVLMLTEQRQLLEEAIQKNIMLDKVSLNIWVRGLAVFNQDVEAAEAMVAEFTKMGVEPDERTIWYLVRAACHQGRRETAIKWLRAYEQKGVEIQGQGLTRLKAQLL